MLFRSVNDDRSPTRRAVPSGTREEHSLACDLTAVAECVSRYQAHRVISLRRCVEIHRDTPRIDRRS